MSPQKKDKESVARRLKRILARYPFGPWRLKLWDGRAFYCSRETPVLYDPRKKIVSWYSGAKTRNPVRIAISTIAEVDDPDRIAAQMT